MKIFILSPNTNALFTDTLVGKLKEVGEVIIVTTTGPLTDVTGLFDGDDERILALDPDFCGWKADTALIATIPNLKAVCLQTTSFSWIDIELLKSKDIPVTNLRGFSYEAVAEWALLMTLALARKIPLVAKGGWNTDFVTYQGIELAGKTAGIIGLGRNGQRIAELMRGIGMNVIAWSQSSTTDKATMVSLDKLFSEADVVIPCLADNAETRILITDDLLRSLKPSAIFVSTIHHIYNHQLLLDMVKDGKLYGYGFENDKPDFLTYTGNIWAGPQIAWATDGSMRKNGEQWTEAILSAGKNDFPNRVN